MRSFRDRLPLIAGWLTALVGLLNVASALTPNLAARARLLLHIEDAEFVPLAHALALAAGVALLVLAVYLGRRRRRALQLAMAILLGAGALNLIKGLDIEEAALNWALAGFLFWGRASFCVRHEMKVGESLRTAPFLIALAFVAGLAAVYAASGSVTPRFDLVTAVRETVDLLLLTSGPLAFHGHFHWVPTAVGILSVSTLTAIAWSLFRQLSAPLRRSDDARLAVELVRRHGDDTLSFFKLREDKQYLFSPDRRAFAGYGVENGVLIVSGDPVGPADALPALAQSLREFADERGLKLAVVGASDRSLALWEPHGGRSFYIGDEAVVDVGAFSLEGRPIRKVRQSVSRMTKAGFEATMQELGELDEATLRQLEQVSERWRQGDAERGFSMAMDSLRGDHLHDSLVLVARQDGAVRGFLHFVPVYGRAAVSLSFMRREHDTPNGLTEFMVARAMEELRARGVAEASLNFAAFARLIHSPSGAFERLLGRLATLFNPYFQIESLYRFNAKFFPRWEPRYLVYEGSLGLPRAGLAAMWAEGQLPKPRPRTRARAAVR